MEISALNYLAIYEWEMNGNDKFIRTDAACFASLYTKTRQFGTENSGVLNIKVYFSKDMNRNYVDNYCLLNDEELKGYINWLRLITKLSVKVSNKVVISDGYSDLNYKIISVKFNKKTKYEVKLICALIRNLYECPYNIMVKTAFLLKNREEYANLDFTERFCIAVNSISGYNTGHSTFYSDGVDFYNDKSLRKRYCKAARTEMNVNGFMLKSNMDRYSRNYFDSHDRDDEDDDYNMFDSLEDGYISDEYMSLLNENYKIMSNNNG